MRTSRGVLYMMLATWSFTFVGLGVKLLRHIDSLQVNFFKALVCMLVCYGVARYKQISIWGSNHYRLLLVRGIAGAIAMILFFITFQYIPLAIASILLNTTPIFTAILGIFVLKQPVSVGKWLCFAMALTGVVITNGVHAAVGPIYILIGLTGALSMGIANNFNSMLKGKEAAIVVVFYMNLFVALGTGGYLLRNFTMLQWADGLILVAMGIFAFLADFLATKAFQLASVAQVAAVTYLGVPYLLVLGFTLLGETYTWTSLLGIGLVLSGSLLSLRY